MKYFNVALILFYFQYFIFVAKSYDDVTIRFIKDFVENENKPTILINAGMCLTTSTIIKLQKDIFQIGVRYSENLKADHHAHHNLYLVDLDCQGSEELLQIVSSKSLFSSPYRWLFLAHEQKKNMSSAMGVLWNSSLLTDSDAVLAERKTDRFTLTEIFKPSEKHYMQQSDRGYFDGFYKDTRSIKELYRRRKNLLGHAIVVNHVLQDSNSTRLHLDDRLELDYDAIVKITWVCIKNTLEMMNATFKHTYSSEYGYENTGYKGLFKNLIDGTADIGTSAGIYPDRLKVADLTDAISHFTLRFIYRQPPLPYVTNIYSLPFASNVWIALVVSCAVSVLTLCLVTKWEVYIGQKTAQQLDGNVSDAFLVTMSAVSQQGCDMEPVNISGRVTIAVLFFTLMALFTSYAANIVVLLQSPSNSIRTIEQLYRSKMTIAANDLPYAKFLLKVNNETVKDTVLAGIYKRVESDNGKRNYFKIEEGVKRIRQGLFAFLSLDQPVYRHVEKTFLETEKCDLASIPMLSSFDPVIPIKKNSPYKELFRVALKVIRESGLEKVHNGRYTVEKPSCKEKSSSFNSVGIIELQPVMMLILFGASMSVAILILEFIVFYISSRYRSQLNQK